MTDSHHSHGHQHKHEHHHKKRNVGGIFTGWAAILALILMLAGIAGYIFTLDESVPPPGAAPAEAQPAAP